MFEGMAPTRVASVLAQDHLHRITGSLILEKSSRSSGPTFGQTPPCPVRETSWQVPRPGWSPTFHLFIPVTPTPVRCVPAGSCCRVSAPAFLSPNKPARALLSHLQGLQVSPGTSRCFGAPEAPGIGVTAGLQVALREGHPTLQHSGHIRATPAVTGKKSGPKLSLPSSACSAGTQEQQPCPHKLLLVTGSTK